MSRGRDRPTAGPALTAPGAGLALPAHRKRGPCLPPGAEPSPRRRGDKETTLLEESKPLQDLGQHGVPAAPGRGGSPLPQVGGGPRCPTPTFCSAPASSGHQVVRSRGRPTTVDTAPQGSRNRRRFKFQERGDPPVLGVSP